MTRHSRQDALTDREFELLLEGAKSLPEPRSTEAYLAILLGGRIGLRPGEIVHLKTDWIDLREGLITIPQHDPCTFGRNGGICGYCHQQARRELENHNLEFDTVYTALETELIYDSDESDIFDAVVRHVASEQNTSTIGALNHIQSRCLEDGELASEPTGQLINSFLEDHNLELEDKLENRWHPKTENSARTVPFNFDTRVEIALERFVEEYEQWPNTRAVINRRITEACEAASEEIDVYPHALRATSATHHAARGVSPYTLQNMFGWKKLATAEKYIRQNGKATAEELRALR